MIVILNIISIVTILLNVFFLKSTFFGVAFFVIWLFLVGNSYKILIDKYTKNIYFKHLIGIFFAFYCLCFFGSIFVVLYKINFFYFSISLILTTIIPLFFLDKRILFRFYKINFLGIKNKILNNIKTINFSKNLILVFFSIIAFSFIVIFYLFKARTGDYNVYQFNKTFPLLWVLFSALICLVFIFILKIKNVEKNQLNIFNKNTGNKHFILSVFLIIFISFIFHSTLPILYKSGFGGDRLRHTGSEKYLQQGNIITPSLFGDKNNVVIKKIGNFFIPEVLIVGNKQSYGNKWTADIFISWIINKDVINIDKYLVFIIWSIFIPIFFINIFKNFTNNKKYLLLFSLGSLFLSPLLIQGSQSDPRSFGLLLFLFFVTLFINKVGDEDFNIKSFILFNLFSILFLYFNYIVFLVIFIIITSFYVLLNKTNIKARLLFILFFSFPILILDLLSGQTFFMKENFYQILDKINVFLNSLFSFGDYTSGIYESMRNFLYFKVSSENYNLKFPWIVNFAPFFSIIFFIFVVLGIVYFYRKQEKFKFLVFSFFSIFLSYFFSFVFFNGVRIFAKRIEIVISIMLILFFCFGVVFLCDRKRYEISNNLICIPLIVFCSLFSVSTLFSGPIMENATESDFKVSKWIYDIVKNDEKYCIIANTWPLLAIEYESGSRIITGGFPQGLEYSQKERVEIFNKMIKNPSKELLDEAKKITGAKKCFLILRDSYIKSIYFGNIDFIGIHEKYKDILKVFSSNKNIDDVKIFIE